MEESESPKIPANAVDRLLVVSALLLTALFCAAIFLFRKAATGIDWARPADWEALGSFVGGVFGPAVAFVALIAVLRTITLQREALSAQAHQFRKMMSAQDEALTAQRRQLELVEKDALAAGAAAYKTAILTLADKRIDEIQIAMERNDVKISSLLSAAATNPSWGSDAKQAMVEAEKENDEMTAELKALRRAVYSFLLKQHQSIADMERDFTERFMPLFSERELELANRGTA